MLFRDARSGVFDMEKQFAALRAVALRNGAFVGELQRIVDEVGDDLNQPISSTGLSLTLRLSERTVSSHMRLTSTRP